MTETLIDQTPRDMRVCVDEVINLYGTGHLKMIPGTFPEQLHPWAKEIEDAAGVMLTRWQPAHNDLLMQVQGQLKLFRGGMSWDKSSTAVAAHHLEQLAREAFAVEMRKRGVPENLIHAARDTLMIDERDELSRS